MKIVLASSNEHKVKEINTIVDGLGIEFILPPKGFDPVEDGKTFEENSLIKAKAIKELMEEHHECHCHCDEHNREYCECDCDGECDCDEECDKARGQQRNQ